MNETLNGRDPAVHAVGEDGSNVGQNAVGNPLSTLESNRQAVAQIDADIRLRRSNFLHAQIPGELETGLRGDTKVLQRNDQTDTTGNLPEDLANTSERFA